MIEIPSDLHPDLVPLAFLLGRWQGAGVADPPGEEQCNVGQEVSFTHDGREFLEYSSHTWRLDENGGRTTPLDAEYGFWRVKDRTVEVVTARDWGVVEVWYGELAEGRPQIELATDALARTSASPEYSGGKRLYGYVKGDLMWVSEITAPDMPLRPYLSAQLKPVVDPKEWVKDIKDLPDDGVAFFR